MGRKSLFDTPMTAAERKALSRANLRADVDVCAGSIMARADALADYVARWDETATDLATGRLKLAQLVEAARAIKEDARAIKARLGIE